jgi:hypothetical protein
MKPNTDHYVSFNHESTRFRCKPENAAKLRATLEKMPKHRPVALRSKNLGRQYPSYLAGHTTTADYVERFNSQFERYQIPIEHHCENYHGLAPMLNPELPEVIEEIDPDYIETQKPVKRKKPTAAHYELACRKALACLIRGDEDEAGAILMEMLECTQS